MMRREVPPPIHLTMDEEDETEEAQYMKQVETSHFKDNDYSDKNKTLNRVK